MKHEYIEGRQATRNFEEGMKTIFKVPKEQVVKAEKTKRNPSRRARARKPKRSDKS
jgi:hypothetical protein